MSKKHKRSASLCQQQLRQWVALGKARQDEIDQLRGDLSLTHRRLGEERLELKELKATIQRVCRILDSRGQP